MKDGATEQMLLRSYENSEGFEQNDCPISNPWEPTWIIPSGKESEVGVLIDDGCFVVLTQGHSDQWKPITHIPISVIQKLGSLAQENKGS